MTRMGATVDLKKNTLTLVVWEGCHFDNEPLEVHHPGPRWTRWLDAKACAKPLGYKYLRKVQITKTDSDTSISLLEFKRL